MTSIGCLAIGCTLLAYAPEPLRLGVSARLEQVTLHGSELEVAPMDFATTPLVLRIVEVWPHGTAKRYDFEFFGLSAGRYDLRSFLRRKDKSPLGELPEMPVEFVSTLPPGPALPAELPLWRWPFRIPYSAMLIAGAAAWSAGLLYILLHRQRSRSAGMDRTKQPETIESRLRPLVEGAIAGQLSERELAGLERTLLALWRRRLHMMDKGPAESLVELKKHAQAGPLLRQFELWLHSPGAKEAVDLPALLAPYKDLPVTDWTVAEASQ